MFTGEEKERWAYRCLMRPPAPGAVPKKGLVDMDFNEGRTINGHHYWGTVIYSRELSADEIDDYDLEYIPFAVLD